MTYKIYQALTDEYGNELEFESLEEAREYLNAQYFTTIIINEDTGEIIWL